MSTDAINNWLKSPEYDSGLEILRTISSNKAKLHFYENRVYKLSQMVAEIKKIYQQMPAAAAKNVKPVETIIKRDSKKAPPHILELKKAADRAWKEARDMQSTIMSVRSKKKRYEMAKRIKELVPFAFENWRKVEQFEETGNLSFLIEKADDKKDVEKMTLLEMVAATKNIPGYITKFKNQLKDAKGKEKTDYLMKMIAEKEAELSEIYCRFKTLNDKIIELCL